MIKGYKDFYYNVKDMKKAVSFYEQAFGMKNIYGDEYWTTMQLGNLNLGLHWTEGSDIPKTPRDGHGQECGGTLTFDSDNIADDRKAIEKCGGKILGETDQDWGHMLVFEDLDGNVLKLMKAKY
ncbi:MAG: VOC family protein [Bacteriovoracaceae bacterium]|nr:VOC family protein [Bacteriovoracaceae bacterium]